MSSERRLLVLACAALVGCAGFSRGEPWSDDGDTGNADDGVGDAPDPDGDGSSGDSGGGDEPTTSDTGAASGPSFATDVLPILRAGCERCHASDGAANTTDFLLTADDDAAYEVTLEFVDVGAPSSSRLLAKTAGQGHIGGVIYDDRSTEYETILAWIENGAMP